MTGNNGSTRTQLADCETNGQPSEKSFQMEVAEYLNDPNLSASLAVIGKMSMAYLAKRQELLELKLEKINETLIELQGRSRNSRGRLDELERRMDKQGGWAKSISGRIKNLEVGTDANAND